MMKKKLTVNQKNSDTISHNEGRSTIHTTTVEALCVVDESGNPVTALYTGKTKEFEAEATSDYYDFHTESFEFCVLGPFVFVINTLFSTGVPRGVYLYVGEKYIGKEATIEQIVQEECILISNRTITFAYRDPASHGFMVNISSYDTGDWERLPLNDVLVNGAVRFYCDAVKKWRWLLPNPQGAKKSWDTMLKTTPIDDFQYFIPSISTLSSKEMSALKQHFLSVLRNLHTDQSNPCSLTMEDNEEFRDTELYPLMQQYLSSVEE